MKPVYSIVLIIAGLAAYGQIYPSEGLNMPGNWDSWYNPPDNNALRGVQGAPGGRVQIKTGLGTNIYQTIFSVAVSGGDLVGGSYQWLFTSGPTGNYYYNKWDGVNVSMNTLQTYTHKLHYITGVNNTVTLTNGKWYTVNFHNVGYSNTSAIFMETSGEPRTITSVTTSQPLTDVYPGNLTVTIHLSGTPASDEYFYLRWTTDNFLTSNIAAFTISGTTGTATIAVLPNQHISFYVFSSSIGSISGGQNDFFYDIRTIHFNNNGGSNYTFTVKPAYRTVSTPGSYNFNVASTWRGGVVPPSAARVEVEANVSVNASYLTLTLDSIELLGAGASFNATGAEITMVDNAALIVPSGTSFTSDFATRIEFAGIGRIPNALTLNGTIIINNELILSPGVVFNDELQIKTGGYISSNAPVWGSNSTLTYLAASYIPGLEWSHPGSGTIGTTPGYPNNVFVGDGLNATTVNFNNLDRAIEGILFVNTSSTFNFNNTTIAADLLTKGINLWGTIHMNNSNRKIISIGDVVINTGGELILSSVIGGDLEIRSGNLINVGGIFNPNNRAIFFKDNSSGGFNGFASFYLPFLIIDNSNVTVYTDVFIEETGYIQLINSSTFTVNSTVTLRANATNYAKLLVCGTCTLSGSSNIVKEAYFAAGAANTNLSSPDYNDGKNGRWYSVGMPMPGVPMNSFDGGSPAFFATATPGPIARWDANTGNYVYPTNIATDNFIAGQGYVIYMGENQYGIITRNLTTQNLVSLTMNVANPSATISLGYTNTPLFTNIFGSNTDGWNLVVNPYLAPLNLQGTSTVNADATAYIYNPTTGNFTTYNFSDPTPFFIAPLQAFWVRATAAGGSINVLAANQSNSANPAQSKPQIQMEHVWLKLNKQDGSEDFLKIYFRQEATDNYENTYDSEKLTGDPTRIGLFSTASGKPVAVDSRSPITGPRQIPVYVYCGNASILTISLESLKLPNGYKAWLEDHLTNQMVEIENGSYTFLQSITGIHHRFTLHIAQSMVGVDRHFRGTENQVWSSGQNLHILLNVDARRGDYQIYDMSGRCVMKNEFEGIAGQHLTFDLGHLRSGVYVVRTRINGIEKSIKFIR